MSIAEIKASGKVASRAYDNDWSPDLLTTYYNAIEEIAVGEWGYNIYPNQMEIISAEGMLESYASIGLPMTYSHWSFGRKFMDLQKLYRGGQQGLAYELIINSNPCISYLMDQNSLTMQVLVMAHACMGHNHFFKNNYLFQQWTMAEYIVDYCSFAKHYIDECEEKYGLEAVEAILDAAHTLHHYCVDKYTKKPKKKKDIIEAKKRRILWDEKTYDPLFESRAKKEEKKDDDDFEIEETENIMYFLEKNAPHLKEWEREILRIVRKIGQYFYPQMFTQLSNEGFATYTHHKLLTELDKRGLVDSSFMFEFIQSHSGVVWQPDYNSPYYPGKMNPYALGWHMYMDIERMCTEPTKEDEEWFPHVVHRDPMKTIFEAVENYKDESFVLQYLSPKMIRNFGLFRFQDKEASRNYLITDIHNEDGYRSIREQVAKDWDVSNQIPQMFVKDIKRKTDRTLVLGHRMYNGVPLDEASALKVMKQIKYLWKFPVEIVNV